MQSLQDNPFATAVPGTGQPVPHRVSFAGSGGEYFRIWIVNVALSLLTFGIYSAWAKVRRLAYFYRQTSLAGSSFEYHGQPLAILKGRVLALVLLMLWQFSPNVHQLFFVAVFAAALVILPWLVTSALRFRLHNSSYRGLRFSFRGNVRETAKVLYLSGLLMIVTLGLALPYFVWRTKKYFFDHSAYGSLQATFQARAGRFFRLYALASLVMSLIPLLIFAVLLFLLRDMFSSDEASLPAALLALDRMALIVAAVALAFLAYLGGYAFIRARIHVLCWDGLELQDHRFRCDLNAWRFTGVSIRNLALTMLTLGLYKPFSDIQLARLLATSICLDLNGDLDSVVAQTRAEERAAGEETAEFLDMDIGL